MKTCRVCIIGESLFAETLGRMLADAEAVEVTGAVSTPEAALPLFETQCPDVVIMAGVGRLPVAVSQFLSVYPDLPLICTDLSTNEVRVITSERIAACSDDLVKAIRRLPTRHGKGGRHS